MTAHTLLAWAELEAMANGRSFVGMTGVRDPETPCDQFVSAYSAGEDRPFDGSCMTDGHYLCKECPNMSRAAAVEREYLPIEDEVKP